MQLRFWEVLVAVFCCAVCAASEGQGLNISSNDKIVVGPVIPEATPKATPKATVLKPSKFAVGSSDQIDSPTLSSFSSQLYSSVTTAFSLTLITEFGDRTFFIAALLATKYDKWAVLLGTLPALFIQSAFAAALGKLFQYLPSEDSSGWRSVPWDAYFAASFLLVFAFIHLREAFNEAVIPPAAEKEDSYILMGDQESAESVSSRAIVKRRMSSSRIGELQKAQATVEAVSPTSGWGIVVKSFWLVFAAELGDKSMIVTVALATAQNPFGVVLGAMGGHSVVTLIAVYAGAILHDYVTEWIANLIAGGLFLVIGLVTLSEGLHRQDILRW